MKSFKPIWLFFIFLTIFTFSCQNLRSGESQQDYYGGKRAGELLAKKDAVNYMCVGYPVRLYHSIKRNISIHLKADRESPRSEAYIRGFKWGYEVEFRDLVDAYCGGGRDDSPNIIP